MNMIALTQPLQLHDKVQPGISLRAMQAPLSLKRGKRGKRAARERAGEQHSRFRVSSRSSNFHDIP